MNFNLFNFIVFNFNFNLNFKNTNEITKMSFQY